PSGAISHVPLLCPRVWLSSSIFTTRFSLSSSCKILLTAGIEICASRASVDLLARFCRYSSSRITHLLWWRICWLLMQALIFTKPCLVNCVIIPRKHCQIVQYTATNLLIQYVLLILRAP